MKIFSVALAFVLAIFINGTALASNWEVVDSVEAIGGVRVITSVDKDSIKKGTYSAKFPHYNRAYGFSAIIKIEIKHGGGYDEELSWLVSFYKDRATGKKMYCLLDGYGKTKHPADQSEVMVEYINASEEVWKRIWDYVESNLK